MANYASKAIGAVGRATGGAAPAGLVGRRIAICMKCFTLKNTQGVGLTCGVYGIVTKTSCGCEINEKASVLNESCPQKKW